ncbi:MAG: invasion associated locus B family protein [Rhizobiaceae bacterium]
MKRLLVSLLSLAVIGLGSFAVVQLAPVLLKAPEAHAEASARPAPEAPAGKQPTLVAQAAAPENKAAMPTTSTTTTTTTHGGWTVTCNEGGTPPAKVCTASFRVINKQNNQNLLVWVFGRNKEGKLLAEFLTLTDVLVQPGVVVTLDDGKPVKADYVECTSRGCKARVELTPNMVRQMKGAKKARIDMTRLDGQVVQFTMDIPGIDLALGDLGA